MSWRLSFRNHSDGEVVGKLIFQLFSCAKIFVVWLLWKAQKLSPLYSVYYYLSSCRCRLSHCPTQEEKQPAKSIQNRLRMCVTFDCLSVFVTSKRRRICLVYSFWNHCFLQRCRRVRRRQTTRKPWKVIMCWCCGLNCCCSRFHSFRPRSRLKLFRQCLRVSLRLSWTCG